MAETSQLEPILQAVIPNREAHAQLLGVLSHLEYVGARKIAKALPAVRASSDHLDHLKEEASHAVLLRRAAEGLVTEQGDHGLAFEAERYLQEVDHGIDEVVQASLGQYLPYETYLFVSLIIEERAMEFYPLYLRLLGDHPVREAVHAILKDEVGHLDEMRGHLRERLVKNPALLEQCRAVEHRAFQTFLLPVMRELAAGRGERRANA